MNAGLCLCGCGNPTAIATTTNRNRGLVKGQPKRFLKGHSQRVGIFDGPGPNPAGLCMCGCGQRTPLAAANSARDGLIKGKPVKYMVGHSRRQSPVDYLVVDMGHTTPCWIWQLSLTDDGYGSVTHEGKTGSRAHCVSYERHVGAVPDGLELDHLCRNRACVNPAHLEPVTHAENCRRASRLDEAARAAIRVDTNGTYAEIGARYGISAGYVGDIKRGRWGK